MQIDNCTLCPRECHANRTISNGFCGGGGNIKLALASLHKWEEPCISGEKGSGAVFFSGCPLKCCFCQNYNISFDNYGKEITTTRLAEIFLELQDSDAHNINLVNPTHYVPFIIEALDMIKDKLNIPVIYNCGGYEKIETLKLLEGYIDVYLPDLKYFDKNRSKRYSGAENYFEMASKAIKYMYNQVGKLIIDENNIIKKGVIIRHLVMPKGYKDSIEIIKWINQNLPKEDILISLMSQYTPFYKSKDYQEINRRLFSFEYHKVLDCVNELGLKGYMQEKSSAKEEYTPKFDLTGI